MNRRSNTMQTFLTGALLAGLAFAVTGCYAGPKPYEPDADKKVRVNRIAMRQLAPEPTYNRLRWVHPPEMVPARQQPTAIERPKLLPVVHLEVENTTMKEVALIIAASTRYRTYVASNVEGERVTINQLGTIDELAEAIEQQTSIQVVIDHQNQSVRFLGRKYIAPQFHH